MRNQNSISRRRAVQGITLLGAGTFLMGCNSDPLSAQDGPTDTDIFNFALNLEYLETEYYLRATTGSGLSAADAGADAGPVTGAPSGPVAFTTSAFREYAEELAANELAHVRYYRSTLGSGAVARPALDLGAFAAAAESAGLGVGFNPFANEINFFLGGFLMEDVGVTAYKGAAPLIQNKQYLEDAAGILAVEAYHMGLVRSLLYEAGEEARNAANAISDARDSLDGSDDLDQPIVVEGRANIVPADSRGIAFSRTPQQVLRIVYLNASAGVGSGGFFPSGFNGAIRVT